MSHDQSNQSIGTSYLSQDRSSSSYDHKKGRNMKEYEEQLKKLTSDNFSLKLRVYFLEEKLGQQGNSRNKEDLCKENMDLKVEAEALKKDLYDKHELVQQASHLLKTLEENHKTKLEEIQEMHDNQIAELEGKLLALQKEVDEVSNPSGQPENLTQLCEIAFQSDESPLRSCLNKSGIRKQVSFNLVDQYFEQPPIDDSIQNAGPVEDENSSISCPKEQVTEQQQVIKRLEDDIQNLQRELEEQEERVVYMEVEIQERDQKLERAAATFQSYQMTLNMNQAQLDSLQKKLTEVPDDSGATSKQVAEYEELLEEKMKEAFDLNQLIVKTEEQFVEQQDINEGLRKELAQAKEELLQHEGAEEVMKQLATKALSVEEDNRKLTKENQRKNDKIKRLIGELTDALNMVEQSCAREAANSTYEKSFTESAENHRKSVSEIELSTARSNLDHAKKVASVRSRRCVEQNLEIRRLTGLLSSTINNESFDKIILILKDLRTDLNTLHESMQKFMGTVSAGRSHARRVAQCATGLRTRLFRSNSAAEELKAQLETLVGLFQELLANDKDHLLRRLSSSRRESLMKSLDDSRLLSQSICLEDSVANDSVADLSLNGTLNIADLDTSLPGGDVELVGAKLCADLESKHTTVNSLLQLLFNLQSSSSSRDDAKPVRQTPPMRADTKKPGYKSFDWGVETDKIVPERLAVSESDVRQSFELSASILQNNPSQSLPRNLSSTFAADTMDSTFDFPKMSDVSVSFLEEENQILQQYILTQDKKIEELTGELSKVTNQPIFGNLEKSVKRLRTALSLPEATSLLHGLEECVEVTQKVTTDMEKLKKDLENRPTKQDDASSVKKIALLKASHVTSEKILLELKQSYDKCREENKSLNKAIIDNEKKYKELVAEEKTKSQKLSSKIRSLEEQIEREFTSSTLGSTTGASSTFFEESNDDVHSGTSSRGQGLTFEESSIIDQDYSLTRSLLEKAEECDIPHHATLMNENAMLREVNKDLTASLGSTKRSLADALDQLHLDRQKKKEQRSAIEKHLGQTHKVLRKASGLMNAASIKPISERPPKQT